MNDPSPAALVLRVVSVLCLLPPIVITLYSGCWALIGIAQALRARRSGPRARSLSVAIIIPAHDEESALPRTLESCRELDYPEDQVCVVVVADNCTDGTELVALRHGVRCLVRNDEIHRGKGFALQLAFSTLMPEGHDVFVVLDADCELSVNALERFTGEIVAGQHALQASYVVTNPDDSEVSYALAVGNVIENDLYYGPKSSLGLATLLRGTGMAFSRRILEAHPWSATGIVEDLDFSLLLYREGHGVRFLPDVLVSSRFPQSVSELVVQRERWTGGHLQTSKAAVPGLLIEAARGSSPLLADLALTILTQSRPIQVIALFIAIAVAVLGYLITSNSFFLWMAYVAVLTGAGLVLVGLAGVLLVGVSERRLRLLLKTPLVAWTLVQITVRSLLGRSDSSWRRTPRSQPRA